MGNNKTTYGIRIPGELKERLLKMSEETGVLHYGLVEHFIKTLCEYYEENGKVSPPFAIIPKRDLEDMRALLAQYESNTSAPIGGTARSKTVTLTANTGGMAKTARKLSGAKI